MIDFRYKISTNLSARVGYFNPAWNDPNPSEKEEVSQADIGDILCMNLF